jgi:uncharacterized protein DUF5670
MRECLPPESHSLVKGTQTMSLANILWAVVVILVVLWLLGLFVGNIGPLIHIVLVVAVIVLLYNLFAGRRGRA